jgi:hypothetical protein
MIMYAIQWYDNISKTWLFCSTKGQLEIYHAFDRAIESCDKWKQGSLDNDCVDEYRVVSVVVQEKS